MSPELSLLVPESSDNLHVLDRKINFNLNTIAFNFVEALVSSGNIAGLDSHMRSFFEHEGRATACFMALYSFTERVLSLPMKAKLECIQVQNGNIRIGKTKCIIK